MTAPDAEQSTFDCYVTRGAYGLKRNPARSPLSADRGIHIDEGVRMSDVWLRLERAARQPSLGVNPEKPSAPLRLMEGAILGKTGLRGPVEYGSIPQTLPIVRRLRVIDSALLELCPRSISR